MAEAEAAVQPNGGAEALASAQQPANQGSDTGAEDQGQQQAADQGNDDQGQQPQAKEHDDGDNKTPWFQKRIDELTAKRHEEARARQVAEQRAQEAQAALAVLLQGQQQSDQAETAQQPQNRPQQPQAEPLTQEQIRAEAAKLVAAQSFDNACNDVFQKGKAEFQDFETSIKTLGAAGVIDNQNPQFLQAALETEAPHKVLQHLGKNPEEAMRIASMNPIRQAIELDRLAQKLAKPTPKPISKAPEPITPISGNGGDDSGPSENDSMDSFVAKRNKQREARRAAGRR